MAAPPSQRLWHRYPRVARAAGLLCAFFFALGAGVGAGGWTLACRGDRCPSIDALEEYTPRQASRLYAVDGRFVAEIGSERRTNIRLADIPPTVRQAFVITEDKRFYSHSGIDVWRVAGAAFHNIEARDWNAQGFSTITMQLARNIFPEHLSREKTLVRKLIEMKVARAIEAKYSKDRILELYLNQIDLGNGAHGVETASQRYFAKSSRNLSVAEAALLAAIPKAPSRYNPRRYPARAIQRRNTIIELMHREGVVGDADASLAKAYPLRLASRSESGDVAPYFVDWVRQELEAHFGKQVYEQGLRVYSTIDLDMQSAAERALEKQLRAIETGAHGAFTHTTYEQYLARSASGDDPGGAISPYLQGAFVAIDPRSGAVRVMIGGRSYDDSKFNRATQALRQAGSTFKPFVYSTAIHEGRPPSYLLEDAPLSVPQFDGQIWTPRNFGPDYKGWMTMRSAFSQSVNLPAIRMGMELGEAKVVDMARRFGITSPLRPYPSIHIGAADVEPLEMVAAYTTFATLGERDDPQGIVRVENNAGEVLWAPEPVRTQVLSREEAWLMVDMMKDVIRTDSGTGRRIATSFTYPAAGKTGTTNDGNDVWFIGYTTDMVAGVWMGFDAPKKIKVDAQGGSLATPAWTGFMVEAYRRRPPPSDWPRPRSIVVREIDPATGLLAGPACASRPVRTEYFLPGTEPIRTCTSARNFLPGSGLAPYQ